MHEAQAILLRLLRFAPGPAWHRNPAPRRTYPRRPVLMPSSRPEISPGYHKFLPSCWSYLLFHFMMETKVENWKSHVHQHIKPRSAAFTRWNAEARVL